MLTHCAAEAAPCPPLPLTLLQHPCHKPQSLSVPGESSGLGDPSACRGALREGGLCTMFLLTQPPQHHTVPALRAGDLVRPDRAPPLCLRPHFSAPTASLQVSLRLQRRPLVLPTAQHHCLTVPKTPLMPHLRSQGRATGAPSPWRHPPWRASSWAPVHGGPHGPQCSQALGRGAGDHLRTDA